MRGLAPPLVLFVMFDLLFCWSRWQGSGCGRAGIIVVVCWRLWTPLCRRTPRHQPHNLSVRLLRILRHGFRWRFVRGLLHGTASSAFSVVLGEGCPEDPRQKFGRGTFGLRTRPIPPQAGVSAC